MKNIATIAALESELLHHKACYYQNGPVPGAEISDAEYDELERKLRRLDPGSWALKQIQFDPQAEVKLPHYVGSLDKLYAEDFEARIGSYRLGAKVDIHPKFDGYALVAHWLANGRLAGLYTRDGAKGKDKTYLAAALGVPLFNPQAARDETEYLLVLEMILPNSVFEARYAKDYANARNALNAIMAAKTISPMCADVHLIGHHWMLPCPMTYIGIDSGRALGHILSAMPVAEGITGLTVGLLSGLLSNARETLDYEIDGLVLKPALFRDHEFPSDGDPDFMVAFKENTQFTNAEVEDIAWEPSAFSKLYPVLKIKPVKLGGVKITNVTAHHAKFVYDNKIGVGTTILLTRGGDVIPKVERVILASGTTLEAPDYFDPQWEGVHLRIGAKAGKIDSVQIRRIYHFFKTVGIESVAESMIERAYFSGIDTLPKLLTATARDFMGLRGVQAKLAANMQKAIADGVARATPATLMVGSCCFESLGQKLIIKILAHKFRGGLIALKPWVAAGGTWEEITEVPGVGPEFARAFANGLPCFFAFEAELAGVVQAKSAEVSEAAKSSELAGKSFVFTGFRNESMEAAIISKGGAVASGVSKKTSYLVAADPSSKSGKAAKARLLGVTILSEQEAAGLIA